MKYTSSNQIIQWSTNLVLIGLVLLIGQSPGTAQQQPQENADPTIAASPLLLPNNYVLGSGDRVRMDLFGVEEYSREYQVLSDGTLNLPLAGSVRVKGMTLSQAADAVEATYAYYLKRPVVTLDLLNARAMRIAIAGEVQRPGSYTMPTEGVPTLTQVVQLAGGITQAADIRQVQIRRPYPQNPGESQLIDASLWELIQSGDGSQDLALQDGDTIVIPLASELDPTEAALLASASFSPEEITVNIVGEVQSPGSVRVPPNTPLNQAMLAAGGFNRRAAKGSVDLIRLNPNGTVSKRDISVDLANDVNESNNPALRNNDTIVVSRSGLTKFTDTLGGILSPIANPLRGTIGLFNLLGF
ncbi:MAG: polysaccharide transporter [Cyanothece sp. SIO1E1]|nr:polysaccharide transporter [Cyanothece sp. SIO1E1]